MKQSFLLKAACFVLCPKDKQKALMKICDRSMLLLPPITFLKSGIYSIGFTVEGQLTPPFPAPTPAWSFSLYLDGVPVSGACFSSFTLFPDELTTTAAGTVIVPVNAGQVLTLQSSSTLPVSIISSVPGSIIPVTSASLIIKEQ